MFNVLIMFKFNNALIWEMGETHGPPLNIPLFYTIVVINCWRFYLGLLCHFQYYFPFLFLHKLYKFCDCFGNLIDFWNIKYNFGNLLCFSEVIYKFYKFFRSPFHFPQIYRSLLINFTLDLFNQVRFSI